MPGPILAARAGCEEPIELAQNQLRAHLVHAPVELAGSEVPSVIAGPASKALPTPDADDAIPPWHARRGINGTEDADDAGTAQPGKVQRARVMRDDGIAGIADADYLG